MKKTKCKCGGTYKITCLMDDIHGDFHCDRCGQLYRKPETMESFTEDEYDLLLEYKKGYIAVIKNKPYRPSIGSRLEINDDDGKQFGDVYYEVIGFPDNVFPIHKNRRWVVEVIKSTPFTRKHETSEVKVYK